MKRILLSLVAIATLSLSSFGQAPEGFKYQAVVRDAGNTILSNQAVGMQMTIQQGSVGGTTVYQETFAPTTNAYGLVNLEIGTGTTSYDFTTIDWANGPYFMETAVDLTGGTSYTVMGTSQLMSVPYALYAENSGAWSVNADSVYTMKRVGIGTSSPTSKLYVSDYSSTGSVIPLTLSRGSINRLDFSMSAISTLIKSSNKEFKIGTSDAQPFSILTNLSTRLYVNSDGDIGIGTTTPARKLHVNDVMRLEPRATAPSTPSKGDIYMDDTTNKLMVYDGTTWQACW